MSKQSPQVFAKKLFFAFIAVLIGIVVLTLTKQTEFMFLLGFVAPYLTIDHVIRNQAEDHPMPLTWSRLAMLILNPSGTLDKIEEAYRLKEKVELEESIQNSKEETISIVKK